MYRLNLQESQLELNCESGMTLYIKKEKRNNLALSPLSPLVVFSLNLWSGLWNQILLQVFFLFCFFPVHVNCLAKKKTDRKKNNLKGIVYLFDSLRILFSYNLSAIKCGFFFFHFKHISCLFLLPVWRHHMFNKAKYLVYYIHGEMLWRFTSVQLHGSNVSPCQAEVVAAVHWSVFWMEMFETLTYNAFHNSTSAATFRTIPWQSSFMIESAV